MTVLLEERGRRTGISAVLVKAKGWRSDILTMLLEARGRRTGILTVLVKAKGRRSGVLIVLLEARGRGISILTVLVKVKGRRSDIFDSAFGGKTSCDWHFSSDGDCKKGGGVL